MSMGFIGLYLAVNPSLPDVESIKQIRLQTPLRIYAADESLIAEFGDTRRIPITLDQVPKNFINALLATEDQRFYEHSGVDLLGVGRAFINMLVTRSKSQGASTITMLVARNYYLSREKRFSRKITEMFLAWKLESELGKNEILELFLNKVHFSHHAYGLGAAAQTYYGKSLDKLSLAQLATLAGIPKGESSYNPISNPENALRRRTHVLGRMLAEGHISPAQYQEANAEPIETRKYGLKSTVHAPYLAEMVRQELVSRFGEDVAYNDGLKVYTSLDPKLQAIANKALVQGLEEYDRRHGYRGAEHRFELDDNTSPDEIEAWLNQYFGVAGLIPALVTKVDDETGISQLQIRGKKSIQLSLETIQWARSFIDENHLGPRVTKPSQVFKPGDLVRIRKLDPIGNEQTTKPDEEYELAQIPEVNGGFVSLVPDTGAIEALVGGYNETLKKFNIVTQANRQLGSNIKPFIYAAAFAKGYTPASIINDMPIVEEDISAENIWRPKNDGDSYLGPTSLRVGLRRSRNTVSIRLMREIGASYAKDYLVNIGFPEANMSPYLSLALGSAAFTPLEVAKSYAVLANGGYQVQPWFIQRIEDISDRIIFEHQPVTVCRECEKTNPQLAEKITDLDTFTNLPPFPVPQEQRAPRVMDERIRYLVNDILKDVIHKGTATPTLANSRSPLLRRQDLAGKTGTTNDAKDAWFSGYNSRYVATTWVGFEDHDKKLGESEFGGRAALPIWQKYMEQVLSGVPEQEQPMPEGIVRVRIDPKTGLLAGPHSDSANFEVFRSEDAPVQQAEVPLENIFIHIDEKVSDDSIF